MLINNDFLRPFSKEVIRLCEPKFGKHIVDEIDYVLRTGMLREGSCTRQFEDCFRKRVHAQYACNVSNGTSALHLALLSSVPPGSKVLVPAFTFIATASAVIHAGCEPVFVDVDDETFLIDLDDAWEKVDEDTRAIIPVHLFGNVVGNEQILELSDEYNLKIINDCAQALGSMYKGSELGEFGDLCCYSFYPSKIITTGEGGMVTTNYEEYAYHVNLLKCHGESEKYYHTHLGYNYRTNEISSILGLDQLNRLDYYLDRRQEIADKYNHTVESIPGIKSQRITDGAISCYNYYTIKVDSDCFINRDEIVRDLKNMNIDTAVHYPLALTEQPALERFATKSCPEAEDLSKEVFSIPIHPYLSKQETDFIMMALKTVVESYI